MVELECTTKSSFQSFFNYHKLLLSTFVFNKNKINIEFHALSTYMLTSISQANLSLSMS